MFKQGLPRFRGRFSVNPGEAAGEIEGIFKAASVGDFLDREAGSSKQGHGELELEEAKCLHGGVPQGGLKKAAEVFSRHAGALGNLAELQGVMRIRFENRPHEIQ